MSLNELRAKAETEEQKVVAETAEPIAQDEPLDEGSSEDEGAEDDAVLSDDFELELDGESEPDQQKPSAEAALIHKLTKQRHKRKEAEDEVAELRRKLEQYESGQAAAPQRQQQPQRTKHDYPPVPVLYEDGIDTKEQYTQAYQRWMEECKAVDQRSAQADQQTEQQRKQLEEKSLNFAKRAAQFVKENKINPDRVVSAIERATSEIDAATKLEGALTHLLDSVGDGSERVAYYIGTNEGAMAKIKQVLADDPSGFRAIALMTRMATDLKPKHSAKTSRAPAPDEPLKGDGSPIAAKRLQEKYDKASSPTELYKLRKLAKEAGVKLTN